jgi:hypothetical protein
MTGTYTYDIAREIEGILKKALHPNYVSLKKPPAFTSSQPIVYTIKLNKSFLDLFPHPEEGAPSNIRMTLYDTFEDAKFQWSDSRVMDDDGRSLVQEFSLHLDDTMEFLITHRGETYEVDFVFV